MRSARRAALILLTAVVLAAGCVGPRCGTDAVLAWTRTELYLGLGRSDGPTVTAEEWRAFLEQAVTPRFPDGLTVLDASGQWRDATGTIRKEPSRLLILLRPQTAETERAIEEIRAAYKQRFAQESVLRTDAPLDVRF